MNTSATLPPDPIVGLDEPVRRRIRSILADPDTGLARLGVAARAGARMAGVLARLEQGGRDLDRQVRELLPLVQQLGQMRPQAGWYQRLVGANLEHDLRLATLRQAITARLEAGLAARQGLRVGLRLLSQERAATELALGATAIDIQAARFVLDPAAADLRARTRITPDWLSALAARVVELETGQAALETARRRGQQLGRRIDRHIDRFDEIRRLSLRLWHERPRAVRAAIRATVSRPPDLDGDTCPGPRQSPPVPVDGARHGSALAGTGALALAPTGGR